MGSLRNIYSLSAYVVIFDWLADMIAFLLKNQVQPVGISMKAPYLSLHTFLSRA